MQRRLKDHQRFIRVFGVRRSGNHAVMAHLRANSSGKVLTLNKVLTLEQDWCSPDKDDANESLTRGMRSGGVTGDAHPDRAFGGSRQIEGRLAEAAQRADTIIAFLEEQLPRGATKAILSRGLWHDHARNVIVQRSFLNWLASVFMHVEVYGGFAGARGFDLGHCAHFARLIEAWRSHAALCREAAPEQPFVAVNFDAWVEKPKIRLDLLQRLGLEGDDTTLPPLQPFGRGSSFAPDQVGPAPEAIALNSRILQVADRPGFRDVLRLCLLDRGFVAFLRQYAPAELSRTEALANGAPVTEAA